MEISKPSTAVLIIYDGDCTFCNAYTKRLTLQHSVGVVELLNARSNDERIQHYLERGYDLDEGMLVVTQNKIYAGPAAMHWLSLHTSGSGFFEVMQGFIFSRRWLANVLYPLLKLGRRVWLGLRGCGLIGKSRKAKIYAE
jgi:predicted DCC family thiol-disulfide oxidoreductase YuxK